MKLIFAFFVALCLTGPSAFAISDPPLVINYQGKLLNSSGTQVADGTYTVAFKFYNGASSTSILWGSSYSVVVSGGFFSVVLGEGGSPISGAQYNSIATALGSTSSPYLGITVLTDNSGVNVNDPQEITPRMRFLSSPYAVNAEYARNADNATYANNAGTVGGLQPNQFLQPASTSPTTLSGALTAPSLTVNGGTTINGSTTVNGDFVMSGVLYLPSITANGGPVPKGAILMWSGPQNQIPNGYALCNGQAPINGIGVPDLRDRFIVGAGNSYSTGATGGNTYAKLGLNHIPAHRHVYRDTIFAENNVYGSGHSPDGLGGGSDGGNNYYGSKSGFDADNSLTWVERYTYNGGTGNGSGDSDAFDIRPPYYALAFIIRVQ